MKILSYYIGISLTFLLFACNQNDNGIQLEQKDIVESVYASVTIQPDEYYEVHSNFTGTISSLYVEEGDSVKQGEIIATINNPLADTEYKNAKVQWQLSKDNYLNQQSVLSQLQNDLALQQQVVLNDSINYARQQELWKQNIGSSFELEQKKLKYENGLSQLNKLQQQYNITKRELESAYQVANNNLNLANENKEDIFIQSRINGLIYSLNKEEGEFVSPQEVIAKIGSQNYFIAELIIDEEDITKVKVGQDVYITLEAYNSTIFKLAIAKIYPLKDERTQTFKVEALFVDSLPQLYAGLTGEANIVIQEKEDCWVVPKEFLNENNEVKTAEGLIKITPGLKSIDMVEILDGIDTNTLIYPLNNE